MYTKVSEIAERYRVSKDAVYLWLRNGLIPDSCVIRVGNTIRISQEEFERLLHEKKLMGPRGRASEERVKRSDELAACGGQSEDQHTIKGAAGGAYKPRCEHRFIDDDGRVSNHPYSVEARR